MAAKYLAAKGYLVLKKNLRLGNQEIDIVCRHKDRLVIVEVKTCSKNDQSSAENMVNARKLKNLKVAGYKLLSIYKINGNDLRYDLIALELDRVAKKLKIRHYKDII